MERSVILAACTLNQWAMDFKGNYERISESIRVSKEKGARYRGGPELEVTGYSCGDHFYESDTFLHSWEVVSRLLEDPVCEDIIVDVGMPVMHKNIAYNCRVIFLNKKLLLIRPKIILCDNGNFRETRWFTAWKKIRETEIYRLPSIIENICHQQTVLIGDAILATVDTCIGFEICEELWNARSTHISQSLDGVEIISNGSAAYHELQNTKSLVDLIKTSTAKCGGIYIFSNLRGCDGDRYYFQGCSLIAMNGEILSKGETFSLQDIEVITSTLCLEDVKIYRNCIRSRNIAASFSSPYPQVEVEFMLSSDDFYQQPSEPIVLRHYSKEEEIARGAACWLWDYLRRSGQGGYFLTLKGDINSSSCAVVVYSMCVMIKNAIDNGNETVLKELREIIGKPTYVPCSAIEICNNLLVTCYMGTEYLCENRCCIVKQLTSDIGSCHIETNIDSIIDAVVHVFSTTMGFIPKCSSSNGNTREIKAMRKAIERIKMVMSYLFAQLYLLVKHRSVSLLVLGTGDADEGLVGYGTKFGLSSADLSPLGSFNKRDVLLFLEFAVYHYKMSNADNLLHALKANYSGESTAKSLEDLQSKMFSSETTAYGILRKYCRCGPYSMFCKLASMWSNNLSTTVIAHKVKSFFINYAKHRHKMMVVPPSYYANPSSQHDNRFDQRQFVYNKRWEWQFQAIDNCLQGENTTSS
ncbi:glutamine-dependent NAD(+) synthetase-like isoform X1 [Stegodyphus dumicola]|uniref:glutamine-dependent NAD(+) synthetase-like isoform X1 n=1 Tax=Stegodyphus dumicola TaxID=202533 RepID=UPI0015B2C4C4|nr:glutamine-dependent NAD(+) synthetase-like isoform X1 [Stegodyphus dumicola]XP_035208832.1 glutamine-dependent NAD(+) synthetase-like isoform X2 [Stegodyphus dumicola]XP_035208839.1 glutamine-dependent NAD(+) synthetase-like isoform X1 [Stegodyphus dumicola]